MERPDQPRFDHFSHHFERIDDCLEDFARQHDWKLIKNPLRKPERDLHKLAPLRVMFGIYVGGGLGTFGPGFTLSPTNPTPRQSSNVIDFFLMEVSNPGDKNATGGLGWTGLGGWHQYYW